MKNIADMYYLIKVNLQLIKTTTNYKPHLIVVSSGRYTFPSTLYKLKKITDSILFSWNPDSPFETLNSSNFLIRSIPVYDCHFIWSKYLMCQLLEHGARKVEWLPFAFDPDLHPQVTLSTEDKIKYGSDMVFIGTWDREREYLLESLVGWNLAVWGNDWDRLTRGSPLKKLVRDNAKYGIELVKILRSSKIVLNILRNQNEGSHNMRTFETTGCGAFLLTPRTQEQSEFFNEDTEIACYSNIDELNTQIKKWLDKDNERLHMGKLAQQKVLRDHTYSCRMKKILDTYHDMKTR